ncbi:MAG: selenide, water dikinase SelD, partial [Desulfobacteraceae bacterium]
VDDPYWFGQIAAANAMSDVYAMGGIPKTAMNLVGFPANDMDISILRRVIQGGLDKMREAGVVLVGGHSVEDKELKYGLSVTGFIHPDRVLTKRNLRQGDVLILTKPLGTGIINTAVKGGLASPEIIETVTRTMAALNRAPAEAMQDYPVDACTDITGFGLLGHFSEMVSGSGCGVHLDFNKIPVLPETADYAAMGLVPAGAYRNQDFYQHMVRFDSSVESLSRVILFDPQTSGGLLICIPGDNADQFLAALKERGITEVAIIGEVIPSPEEIIAVS